MKQKPDETIKWVFYILAVTLAAIVIIVGMFLILYLAGEQSATMIFALFFLTITIVSIVAITHSTKGISDIVKNFVEFFK